MNFIKVIKKTRMNNHKSYAGIVVFGLIILLFCLSFHPTGLSNNNSTNSNQQNISQNNTRQVSTADFNNSANPVSTSNNRVNSSCHSGDQASSYYNQSTCIDFTVQSVYESRKGNKFLNQYSNYSSGFSVYIPNNSSASSLNIDEYLNKEIIVSGTVTKYRGGPQITVETASQVQLK